jgi:spectinomycin phosphotransferase
MRFEPLVDQPRLLDVIANTYGIPAQELTFVPASSGAACYMVAAGSGALYFLKLWLDLRLGGPEAATQHARLAITRTLHDRGLDLNIPYPVLTRDSGLWADLSGIPFALFPFLPGKRPTERWPVSLSVELGQAVAAIHRATPSLAGVLLPRETLDVAFEPELRRNLQAASQLGSNVRPALLALRQWVQLRRDNILAQLSRLRRPQMVVRQLDSPVVLCHTDLHSNNLLVEDGGKLGILDWDDLKLAPPEHDLWAGLGKDYRGEPFDVFLDAYRDSGGAAPLYLEHFAFYLLRRCLEDVNVCMTSLLDANADEREDAVLMHGVDECFARWSRLDETLATISTALGQDRPLQNASIVQST